MCFANERARTGPMQERRFNERRKISKRIQAKVRREDANVGSYDN
jgi:hypothetical protein